ncbi:MAG: HAD hydrolase-like protein [Chloroflexota bacterium]
MAPPLLYLFDIDGTLLSGAVAVHRAAFAHAYHEVYHRDADLNGIVTAGRTDSWILAETLRRQGLDDESIKSRMPRAFHLMEMYVAEHLEDLRHTVLPGVREVLEGLRKQDRILGLLTGNLRGIAHSKIRHAGLEGYFVAGGYGEESQERSHLVPVALREAAGIMQKEIDAREAVLVGDTPLDVEAGRHSGARVVAVATGRYSMDDLRRVSPDLLLANLAGIGALEALLAV